MYGRFLVATLVTFLFMSHTETVSGSQRRWIWNSGSEQLVNTIPKALKREECILCECFKECHAANFNLNENDLCKHHDYHCKDVDRCTCCNDLNHVREGLFDACHNGGTCHNEGHGGFSCVCPPGINGTRCENRGVTTHNHEIHPTTAIPQTNKDYCAPHPCFNLGTCINRQDRFECQCTAGWTGVTCKEPNPESHYTTVTVFPQTNVNQHITVSPQNPVNHCAVNPCFNNGTCIQLHDTFSCQCKAGWTGEDCNTDVDECFLYHPCKNGGTCINTPGHLTCQCSPGWSGGQCQTEIHPTTAIPQTNKDYCAPHPCFNLGTCINRQDRFECQCTAGWTGVTCKEPNPESHYTTVTVFPQTNVNQHITVSPQNPVNHCAVNPCFNNGTCIQLHDTFSCQCKAGWTGEDCNTDVDECFLYHPCKNGGTCINTPGHLTCQCSPGWSGGQCQTDIDECLTPNFCQNGGTCTNAIGNYKCQCNSGFIGAWCETEFPKCNHTCALDAVILSRAVGDENHNCTDGVHFPHDILPKSCCNISGTWRKGNEVQPSKVCTDSQIPPYTPIAAFTNTKQVPKTSGIFYGCIKNGKSGFLMIHQNCSTMPQLLTVDSSSGLDPNSFFVIY